MKLLRIPKRHINFSIRKEADSYYKDLGVKQSATPKEIKLAYYKLAKQYHPDFNTDDDNEESTEKFKKIQKAYEVLKNPI